MSILSRRKAASLLVALVTAVPVFFSPSAAVAEDMAGNWTVVGIAEDACGKMNPLREGYINLANQAGWGWQKIFYKHGISRLNLWRAVMTSSCGQQDGAGSTTWVYRMGLNHEVCNNNHTNCEVVDSLAVRAVSQRKQFNGERKGTITMYCEGYTGFCPAWVNTYGDDHAREARRAMNNDGDEGVHHYVTAFTPEPLETIGAGAATESLSASAMQSESDSLSRAGQVLSHLRGELERRTVPLAPQIVELREVDADTVEVVYTYPGYDGLIGLRRDVAEVDVDVASSDRVFELAANENDPAEIATMLRLELEEPPPADLAADGGRGGSNGVAWWGAPLR